MANEDSFHLGIKALIRNTKGKILLLQVNPAKLVKNNGGAYWDIPGGRIHKNSSIKETLLREVEEETGIKKINKFYLFSSALSNIRIPIGEGTVGLILFVYLCTVGKNENIKISDEHISYKWFSKTKAAKLLSFKYPLEFTKQIKQL